MVAGSVSKRYHRRGSREVAVIMDDSMVIKQSSSRSDCIIFY